MLDMKESRYREVRALTRGLDLLAALNRNPDGRSTITELAQATGIHRTTVRRLLQTLLNAGYVKSSASNGDYYVTLQVRNLSSGFTDREWISAIATPAMDKLQEKIKWPSDLTTLDGAYMLIRESTHGLSPLSFSRGMVGQRMPVLLTASGRVYLAACSESEQREVIKLAKADGGPQAALAQNLRLVNDMIAQVRRRGYGVNEGDWHKDSRTGVIALPIVHRGNPVACLNVIYARRAMNHEQAVREYLSALRETIQEIEEKLHANPTVLAR